MYATNICILLLFCTLFKSNCTKNILNLIFIIILTFDLANLQTKEAVMSEVRKVPVHYVRVVLFMYPVPCTLYVVNVCGLSLYSLLTSALLTFSYVDLSNRMKTGL